MIPKVTITGTESTGKTTLAEQLGEHFRTLIVPDISRQYIASLHRPYNREDVIKIAEQIIAEEERISRTVTRVLLSDNDLINIKIWLRYYQWEIPEWIEKEIATHKTQLYLLCYTDVPWQADEQRANSHDRNELYQQFVRELEMAGVHYEVISGSAAERRSLSIELIEGFL